MHLTDMEILAQLWVGGETGDLERAVIDVERTDRDEIRIGVRQTADEDNTTHVYLPTDKALRLAHTIVERSLEPFHNHAAALGWSALHGSASAATSHRLSTERTGLGRPRTP